MKQELLCGAFQGGQEARTVLEATRDSSCVKWDKFQSALDAYRDAAYWAGYEDAKKEWIRQLIADMQGQK